MGAPSAAQAPDAAGHPSAAAVSWAPGPPLPSARDHHATFLVDADGGAYLYVVGGATYHDFYADAYAARIAPDGSLGAWTATTPLPVSRAGHGVVVSGTHVVISGGKNKGGNAREVFLTDAVGGTLAPWRAGTPLPAPRFHHSTVLANGFVYATGGLEATSATANVFRAPLAPDGSLGEWTELRPLPSPRSHHSSFVHGGYLYVVGGLAGDPIHDDDRPVLDAMRAHLEADGSLGPWSVAARLDHPRMTHANAVADERVYLIGGIEDDWSAGVARASFAPDGSLTPWETVEDSLPHPRGHMHHTPVWQRHVYAVGGSVKAEEVSADVSVGTFR